MNEAFERTIDRERAVWKLLAWLIAGAAGFVVLDFVGNRSGWVHADSLIRLCNIGREDSLHNFVSSVQELAVAGVALVIYLQARKAETRFARFEWGIAFVFFAWVGFDDGAAIHEAIGTAAENSVTFFPSYSWQVIFVPIFTGCLAVTAHVLYRRRRAPYTVGLFLAAFGLYIVSVLLDYAEGRPGADDSIASFFGVRPGLVSHYSRVIEEFLEDGGASLFLIVLLRHLLYTVGSFRVVVTAREQTGLDWDEWPSGPRPSS